MISKKDAAQKRKLRLVKTTLRVLQPVDLTKVQGGKVVATRYCQTDHTDP